MTGLALGDELTIVTAAQTRDRITPYLAAATDLELDLSEVSDIDTAGLQLLLMARREAERRGATVTLADPSPAVQDLFEFTHLSAELQ